jgi:hypothetical protein
VPRASGRSIGAYSDAIQKPTLTWRALSSDFSRVARDPHNNGAQQRVFQLKGYVLTRRQIHWTDGSADLYLHADVHFFERFGWREGGMEPT